MSRRQHCPTQLGHVTASNGKSVAANFGAWFRKSKVVDSAGRPLVVYHGTDKDFQAFDKACIGDNFRADEAGFFFTSDPASAGSYAENDTVGINKRLGCHIIPAYISLQCPLIVDDGFLRAQGMHPVGVHDDCISFWDTYQSLVLEWREKSDCDGIILVDHSYRIGGEPTRMVVAMEPWQIKSALGNSGLYSPHSGNLADAGSAPAPRALLDQGGAASVRGDLLVGAGEPPGAAAGVTSGASTARRRARPR